MKILHTADWHLGQVLFGFDRIAEQEEMLSQIGMILEREQPDVLLVCGDIFHTASPSFAAQRAYNLALTNFHSKCPEMSIIVIAGNHDSPSRLTVNNCLWEHFRVNVLGSISRLENGLADLENAVFEIKNPSGESLGFIATVPHTWPENFPAVEEGLDRNLRQSRYFKSLAELVRAKNPNHLPVVLAAHLSVENCDTIGHDLIGGIEYTAIEDLGPGYDYIALGHIHRPQNFNAGRVRYCGTPLAVNFGEDFTHSVSLVNLQSGCEPQIEEIEIHNPVPLMDLPKEPAPFSEVLETLKTMDSQKPCYLRLMVKQDSSLDVLYNERIAEAIVGKELKYCRMQVSRDDSIQLSNRPRISVQEMQSISPVEIASMYFASRQIEFSPEMKDLIEVVVRQVKAEEGQEE